MDIRCAEPSDAQTLVTIINAAFRVEKFFIEGDRIEIDQVREFLGKGDFLIAEDAGCVYIEPRGTRCYLGLLSVNPATQGTGLGRKLLSAAEQRARELYCEFIDIRVVNLREELPPFYRRLGYVECGTSEFTPGVPTLVPCHFLHMFKPLA
jgi:GNAT superfamily N-acetyltransferase